MLEYKGYFGEVSYDAKTNTLYAKVVNSGAYSIADAESTDEEGIRREFRKSIDVYLNGCAELGIEPVAPTSQSVPSEAVG